MFIYIDTPSEVAAMKKLFTLALAAVLALTASLPALASPELPDGKINVACSSDIFVVSPDGILVGWGADDIGMLQICGVESESVELVPDRVYLPPRVLYSERAAILGGVRAVEGSERNIFVIMDDGGLYACGADSFNSLAGRAPRDYSYRTSGLYNNGSPYPVKIMDDVVMVSGGFSSFAALRTDGSVWAWGRDSYTDEAFGPVKILDGCKFMSDGVAIKENGDLYVWGSWGTWGTWYGYDTPTMITTDVFAANLSFIHMENGDLYDADRYIAAMESNAAPPVPIARNVRKLCPGGYITEDGALYTRLDSGEHVKLLDGGVESAFCAPYVYVAITEDGLVYASEIGSGYETLACVGTVDDLAPEYDPPLNPWPLILGVANKIFELIPLLAMI